MNKKRTLIFDWVLIILGVMLVGIFFGNLPEEYFPIGVGCSLLWAFGYLFSIVKK
jgi:hypothetical protein